MARLRVTNKLKKEDKKRKVTISDISFVRCSECGQKFELDDSDGSCPSCGNPVTEDQVQ